MKDLLFLVLLLFFVLVAGCPGCPPAPEDCGSVGAERCNAAQNRIEYCASDGHWLVRNDCNDVTPGKWTCGSMDGGALSCVKVP